GIDQVEDLGVVEIAALVETAGADDAGKQDAVPTVGRSPLNAAHAGRLVSGIDEDVAAEHHSRLNSPNVVEFDRDHCARMSEWVVNKCVRMRQQGVAWGVVGLDTVLAKDAANFHVHAPGDGWKIGLGVKLNRINAVEVGLPVVGSQLAGEEAASH